MRRRALDRVATAREEARQWALELLADAYAGGQLDAEELEQRTSIALAAGTTDEIDAAVEGIGLSVDDLAAIVDEVVTRWAAEGWEPAAVSDARAVLVRRKPPNHPLHALLTIVTGGLWGFVWIALALSPGEHRVLVELDDFGNVSIRRLT